MQNNTRFFVSLFGKTPEGDPVLADTIEVPSEEIARNLAKSGALDRPGAAAIAIDLDARNSGTILRSYGLLPPKLKILEGLQDYCLAE